MPLIDSRSGTQVDTVATVDLGVDLSDLAAERPLQGDSERLDHDHFLPKLARRCRHLGSNKPRANQEQAFRAAQGLAESLAVAERPKSEHVVCARKALGATRGPAQTEHQDIERNLTS